MRVVDTPADLPIVAPDDARGLYMKGSIYVVGSSLKTREDIISAIAHEAVAQMGLRERLGREDWKALMTRTHVHGASSGKLQEIRD